MLASERRVANATVTPDTTGRGAFRRFFNPATGESSECTSVAEDVVRFDWRSLPGGSVSEHRHPHDEERFAITDGEARVVGPGETIVVPAGVRHSVSNGGAVSIEGAVELRPARRSKEMHGAFS
jgi:mannose-6-phosphate isomerase-like protein (cupin superfamily)